MEKEHKSSFKKKGDEEISFWSYVEVNNSRLEKAA